MNSTLTPSTSTTPSAARPSGQPIPPPRPRPAVISLTVFVAIGGAGLGIALITGATVVFNVLVFAMFTVLWIALLATLAFSPESLDDVWHETHHLPLVIRGAVWLLFLPLMIGLWIWERTWSLPIRLVLIIALGVWNIFVFYPRG